MRGGPWSEAERASILDYCQSDVDALERLLSRMAPGIDLPRALLRGRFMVAAARIQRTGVPIDAATLAGIRDRWESIKEELVAEIDQNYGCYDGTTFKLDRFERFLSREGIAWPRLDSGQLDLRDDTFREISKSNPRIAPLRELRSSLSQMRLADLAVGSDNRNRTVLWAFSSKTGRNQPSSTQFCFGPARWLRGLIKPEAGRAMAYIDWSSQEFGIAAALSGDRRMMAAYLSGDPYLAFAKQCGAVPADGTKFTHKHARDLFKTVVLGVGYGMEADALARRLAISPIGARELLRKHRETYPAFWRWTGNVVDTAMCHLGIRTVFGWQLHTSAEPNPRSIRNFPMQANGAEMLRIACILGTERGVQICATVHDAILIEAADHEIESEVKRMKEYMRKASQLVLGGFELRTDADILRWPERYTDQRGEVMWARVMRLITAEGLRHVERK
jgi:hypothetical protein